MKELNLTRQQIQALLFLFETGYECCLENGAFSSNKTLKKNCDAVYDLLLDLDTTDHENA